MKKLAIDFSSFAWRALLAGTDHEYGRKVWHGEKQVIVNSADHGYENITNMLTGLLKQLGMQPIDTILVFEGINSKARRLSIDEGYKVNREGRPTEAYVEFQKLRDQIAKVWRDLGAASMTQDRAEGDDTLAWLAQEYPHELIVATYDGDLTALNTEEGETNKFGGTCKVWINGQIGLNKFGGFPYKRVRIYKTLVGDPSDGIKGAFRFGEAAFFDLVELAGWDGIDELEALLEADDLNPLRGLAAETSKLGELTKKIVDSDLSVRQSWKLVKLRPEWVRTMQNPLKIVAGKVALAPEGADSRLIDWYGDNHLIIADNYEDAVETVRVLGRVSPFVAFDIETSTPEASDDWLASCNDLDGVDTLGSKLTGFSLTFGRNMQTTLYVSVAHAGTKNVTMLQARKLLEEVWALGLETVMHNTFFELPVIYNAQDEDGTYWRDCWKKNGQIGFIPRALDTKLEASYVDENLRQDLKARSLEHLDYEQATFKSVTVRQGLRKLLPEGGRLTKIWAEALPNTEGGETSVEFAEKRYKMRELTAQQVFSYGCDDTICTAGLHNYFRLVMDLEHTWDCYLETEIAAAYLHAKSFVDGIEVSIQKSKELEAPDDVTYKNAWAIVRTYLVEAGWPGVSRPVFTPGITTKEIKYAYAIVTEQLATDLQDVAVDEAGEGDEMAEAEEGDEMAEAEQTSNDPILSTRTRTPGKMPALLRSEGHEVFAGMLERCLAGDAAAFTGYVCQKFKGDPEFKASNKMMCKLLYETMGCPIVVRGKPTDIMRSKGIYKGNPKGDALALAYALRDMEANIEVCQVLDALKLLQMVRTRRSFYYSKYPNFVHWLTGRIHVSHNQSSTNTRRASESKPNKQQLPKHPKIEGQPARFREVIVPHKPGAVIVSMDFDSQEIRIIADYSKDSNMVSCLVGSNLKSMHSMTGAAILKMRKVRDWDYEIFQATLEDKTNPDNGLAKEYRALGKKVNFTTEFGAMARKLAATLLCSEAEADLYIKAKEAMFPAVVTWKENVVAEVCRTGQVRDMGGAVRHLHAAVTSRDRWVRSKAERQGVNTLVQGSAAQMTKRAEGRMWLEGLFSRFDSVYYGPVHDECVCSVMLDDLYSFLPQMHACMVGKFVDMQIPVMSSISFGPDFGRQLELGLEPSEAAILKGIEQYRELYVN